MSMAEGVLIAYSFNSRNLLIKIPEEINSIIRIIQETGLMPEPLQAATQDMIEKRFRNCAGKYLIFHYAGHAKGPNLELNTRHYDAMQFTDMSRFAKIIGEDGIGANGRGLKLVFLNGCTTSEQAGFLREAGVPAVISSPILLPDSYAFRFAEKFYEKFLTTSYNYTLQEAFDRALNSFASEMLPAAGDTTGPDPTRDISGMQQRTSLPATTEVYRLDADPEVLRQRLVDWVAPAESKPREQVLLDDNPQYPLHKIPESYLLCNRAEEEAEFKDILREKHREEASDPTFIFLNASHKDCPYELIRRFEHFTSRRFNRFIPIKELEFPTMGSFGLRESVLGTAKGDPNTPMMKLKEYFDELSFNFSKKKEKAASDKFSKDTILVLWHHLGLFWTDALRPLFDYYLGTLSVEIKKDLCEQVVVICFLEYEADVPEHLELANKYRDLFAGLKKSYPNRVAHWNELQPIYNDDLRRWHRRVFEEDLEHKKLNDEGDPFAVARTVMKTLLNQYNETA